MAVPSYYLAAMLLQGDDLATIWAPASLLWMLFGVPAGVVFGIGGTWARETGRRQIVGTALPAAVFFAEAAGFVRKATGPDYGSEVLWNVAIDVVLSVLVVALIGRTGRQRSLALARLCPWPRSSSSHSCWPAVTDCRPLAGFLACL